MEGTKVTLCERWTRLAISRGIQTCKRSKGSACRALQRLASTEPRQTESCSQLVLSGPGTGKSRMLDEMKALLCKAAVESNSQDLIKRMENAYIFRVTFENGTSTVGSLLDYENPELDIRFRMLYQLAKERKPWGVLLID